MVIAQCEFPGCKWIGLYRNSLVSLKHAHACDTHVCIFHMGQSSPFHFSVIVIMCVCVCVCVF